MGQRKNLSPRQDLNLGPPKHRVGRALYPLSCRELMESEAIYICFATLLEQDQVLQMLVLGLYRPCNNINVFPNAFSL